MLTAASEGCALQMTGRGWLKPEIMLRGMPGLPSCPGCTSWAESMRRSMACCDMLRCGPCTAPQVHARNAGRRLHAVLRQRP